MKSAVFLDRDGVVCTPIIRDGKSYPPKNASDLKIIYGVKEAVQNFRNVDLEIVIITNQPDIGSGLTTFEEVNKINEKIMLETSIKHVYVCPHIDSDNCECRKPKIGLFIRSAHELNISLHTSYMVGDRWKDIKAGQEAGCENFFIDYSYNEKKPNAPYTKVESVLEASKLILKKIGAKND